MAGETVVGLWPSMATQPGVAHRLVFDGFELDVRAGELRKHGVRLRGPVTKVRASCRKPSLSTERR
jgi:hypothetical protein